MTDQYAERLANDGLVTADEVKSFREIQRRKLYEIYDQAQKNKEQFELQELSSIPAEVIQADQPGEAVDRAVLETHRRSASPPFRRISTCIPSWSHS